MFTKPKARESQPKDQYAWKYKDLPSALGDMAATSEASLIRKAFGKKGLPGVMQDKVDAYRSDARIRSAQKSLADQRASAQNQINMNRSRANRRRVRGGLFGDMTVDQNVQARLG